MSKPNPKETWGLGFAHITWPIVDPYERNIMPEPVYGQCIQCGCVEVELDKQGGVQDLSHMGEDPKYPFGFPCEVCKHRPSGFRSATAPRDWRQGTTFGRVVQA